MKRFILGFLLAALLCVPASAVAYKVQQKEPYANKFLNVDEEPNTVSVFDDGNYKCYIVNGTNGAGNGMHSIAMSCVNKDR